MTPYFNNRLSKEANQKKILFVCLVWGWVGIDGYSQCAIALVWRSEDNLCVLILSFHHVSPVVVRLGA